MSKKVNVDLMNAIIAAHRNGDSVRAAEMIVEHAANIEEVDLDHEVVRLLAQDRSLTLFHRSFIKAQIDIAHEAARAASNLAKEQEAAITPQSTEHQVTSEADIDPDANLNAMLAQAREAGVGNVFENPLTAHEIYHKALRDRGALDEISEFLETEEEVYEADSSETLLLEDDLLTQLSSIPAPPPGSGKGSRKRPCAKNNNRRREQLEGAEEGDRRPRQRKLNQYYLDTTTGRAVAMRPGVEVPKGVRVVEQLPGNPAPTLAQFFDASLLPEGSAIIPVYGYSSEDLDQQLVARLGRLAGLAGVGRQSRRTTFDVIARCTNPTVALSDAILALGGPGALDCDFKDLALLDGLDRDSVRDAVSNGVNAGNSAITRFTEELPSSMIPNKRLLDHLSDLPGRVLSIEASGTGSAIEVRCFRHEDMEQTAESLRQAGGRRVRVSSTKEIGEDGKSRKAFTISGEFACSPAELAAARGSCAAKLEYAVNDEGRVVARYSTRLFDQVVTTPEIPAQPSREAVLALLSHVVRTAEEVDLDTVAVGLEGIHGGQGHALEPLLDLVGPVTTVEEALAKLQDVTLQSVLGEETHQAWVNRPTSVETNAGRDVSVIFRSGKAVLLEEAYHLTDRRILEMPDQVEGPLGATETTIREVVFSTGKNGRVRANVKETPIAELKRRRAEYIEKTDPEKALLTEIRENVVNDVARAMGAALVEGRPDGSAKSRARNKHLEHALADGGALVTLVATLAADPALGDAGASWSKWCAQNIARYRNLQVKARNEGRKEDAPSFWSIAPESSRAMARQTVEAAALSFLSIRLGRDVSTSELDSILTRVQGELKEAAFTGFDRGRAVARAEHNGVSIL